MTAVVGGNPEDVLEAIAAHGLTAANHNGSGQIVAAGTKEQLAGFAAQPPARASAGRAERGRCVPTVHMEPAVAHWPLARAITTHDPRTRLLSNADGQVVHSGREVLKRLVAQVASPVRWDLCMIAMADLGVTGLLEMPPAGTLTGIAKRNLKASISSRSTPRPVARGDELRPKARRPGARLANLRQPHVAPSRLAGQGTVHQDRRHRNRQRAA